METANLQRQDLEGKDFLLIDKQVDSKQMLMEKLTEFSLSVCEDCGIIFDSVNGGKDDLHYSSCNHCIDINTFS